MDSPKRDNAREYSPRRRWPLTGVVALVALGALATLPASPAVACPTRGIPCRAFADDGKVMFGMYPGINENAIVDQSIAREKHEVRVAHRKARTSTGRKKIRRKVAWAREHVGGGGFREKGHRLRRWLRDHNFPPRWIRKHWRLAVTSCFANGFAAFLTWKEQGGSTKRALVAAGFGCQSGVITAFLARR